MHLRYLDDIYLPVRDVEKAASWYMKHFGLTRSRRESTPGGEVTLSFRTNHFVLVESPRLNRYTHIPFNFHTNRLEEWRSRLEQQSITVTELVNDEDVLCCDFYDLDGNRVGLVEEQRAGLSEPYIEVGGTFLAVRDLDRAVEWYGRMFDFDFSYFSGAGAAGYVGPTPAYVPGLPIRYAAVKRGGLGQGTWTRIALVQTPEFHPLIHMPYSIRSGKAEADFEALKSRGVTLSAFHREEGRQWFHFFDLDGNEVRVVEYGD